MCDTGIIRRFETQNFTVTVEAEPEYSPDFSFDETGEVAEKINSGEFVVFCVKASVTHNATGEELATDYLGNCIYGSIIEFMDHREIRKAERDLRARGIPDPNIGSYFVDMVKTVCEEARKELQRRKELYNSIRIRA